MLQMQKENPFIKIVRPVEFIVSRSFEPRYCLPSEDENLFSKMLVNPMIAKQETVRLPEIKLTSDPYQGKSRNLVYRHSDLGRSCKPDFFESFNQVATKPQGLVSLSFVDSNGLHNTARFGSNIISEHGSKEAGRRVSRFARFLKTSFNRSYDLGSTPSLKPPLARSYLPKSEACSKKYIHSIIRLFIQSLGRIDYRALPEATMQ
ncbi:hypothetical protein Ciccas_013928 [Cichlidogyrus casuarinus]|uniref:Uncharacterized protein n=1 Tax=Cichlidogyrus casuarinus TaxID=1844966 RepID=A0ABD2PKC8_9PLAT